MQYLLGIDIGTRSAKAVLVDVGTGSATHHSPCTGRLIDFEQGVATERESGPASKEKELQVFVQDNLHSLFRIYAVASEFDIGPKHRGRVDTLGIDENGCPAIIEYKRGSSGNILSQGLSYMAWLVDHKAEFESLVRKRLGDRIADGIDWRHPRLLCIARIFRNHDVEAAQHIGRDIELVRYAFFTRRHANGRRGPGVGSPRRGPSLYH